MMVQYDRMKEKRQKIRFFQTTFFLMQIELYILLSGDRKPTLLRILTLILLVYDEPFQIYEKPMKIACPEISMAVDRLNMTSIIKK